LPSPFEATRYHSLTIAPESVPDCLEITAKTDDGVIMGVQHKTKPIHGVQFHPESIATQHGHAMLKNFLDLI
ncbi:MAG TPA: gamma-glutamyl-gamma-aminobutyrate hydrolase family protein, partial [Alphaproteobacteria bacterium]|nr:gamma-glutamyl-gamma-aminobutyrate hydrolase family protein [Alphaproteobacteria bacterium]